MKLKKTAALSLVATLGLGTLTQSVMANEETKPQPLLPAAVTEMYKAPAGLVITDEQKQTVLTAVKKASKGWRDAFNNGDAKKAASFYEQDAVTTSIPFGIYMGQTAAEGLWDYIISNGYKDVKYFDTKIEVISSDAAVLSGSWEMNKAYGIITKELWVVGKDGLAKLRVDDFEVVGAK
ncbi:hypothetical protein [Vibrio sagamiensis]|uniref:SnoaL-like domain-containing protein n=1 Tax=Vibrio sagamiensis NBRC 104589 TaxID=1219064 RepID=A0A511QEE5_9VIBR|nr:hypothetical protein [Vibrio sagamiensis]PNQ54294.1 isochorismatase [Vibrio agarivorans]GEM75671.1 hypothetical protein VSA01S_17830 [Vibrio sagamiensis NBRC 104589]